MRHDEHSTETGCCLSQRLRPDETLLDLLISQAAAALAPSTRTEEEWLRQSHRDVGQLPTWEIVRAIRVISWYLATPRGARDRIKAWYVERLQVLQRELRQRGQEGQP